MPSYRVCFINEIPRNDRLFRCCQRSIVVPSAAGAEEAKEVAKEEFARLEGIRDWKNSCRTDRTRGDRYRGGTGDAVETVTTPDLRELSATKAVLMRKMADIVRNQDPLTLPPSATVREACQSMRDRRVGAVLVTEGDRGLVGIFTGRDAVHRVLAEGKSAARTTLAEVMTPDPDTMPPGKVAIDALRLMEDGRYRHLPIVDSGKIVGIVSRFDFSGIELDRLDEETGLWERI